MKSLKEAKVGRVQIQQALEQLKGGRSHGNYSASRTTYIRCPVDLELWDLKPVVCTALAIVGKTIDSIEFNTADFQRDLVRLGFPVVKFDDQKSRKLGINGFDLSELEGQHTVFWPPSMSEQRNGFAVVSETGGAREVGSKTIVVTQFVRNSELRRKVREAAKGVCQSCGERAFQTSDGEWFLEVHHKTWLSEGGPDVEENLIALCPNCHRQEHFGKNRRFY